MKKQHAPKDTLRARTTYAFTRLEVINALREYAVRQGEQCPKGDMDVWGIDTVSSRGEGEVALVIDHWEEDDPAQTGKYD